MAGRIPFTNISVDYWKLQSSVQHYFLTHMHADHYDGLHDGWNFGTIYCSSITKKLLLNKFTINPDQIKTLETGQTSLIYLDSDKTCSIEVTPIDAHHCPGAVMFLFDGYFGRLLHTGDFRFSPSMLFVNKLTEKPIDYLYFDNTFCDPMFVFPSQGEAKDKILEVIRKYPNHDVAMGIDNLGKEELLLYLAIELDTKIVVTEDRMKDIQCIEYIPSSYFTTDPTQGFIKVVPRKVVSEKNVQYWNRTRPTIGIVASGWSSSLWKQGKLYPSNIDKPLVYYVPYSLHSSFPELKEFIANIRPKRLIPLTPKNYSDVSMFSKYLDPNPVPTFKTPDAIYHNAEDFYKRQTSEDMYVIEEKPKPLRASQQIEPVLKPITITADDDEKLNEIEVKSDQPPNPVWVAESKQLINKFYPNVNLETFAPAVQKENIEKWSQGIKELMGTSNSVLKVLNTEPNKKITVKLIKVVKKSPKRKIHPNELLGPVLTKKKQIKNV